MDEARLGPSLHNRNRPRGTTVVFHGDGLGSERILAQSLLVASEQGQVGKRMVMARNGKHPAPGHAHEATACTINGAFLPLLFAKPCSHSMVQKRCEVAIRLQLMSARWGSAIATLHSRYEMSGDKAEPCETNADCC